jgi:hypothetical protein
MDFPPTYFLFIVIVGLILLYSYYHFLQKTTVDVLWGRIRGSYRSVYYVSMLLAAIGFLFLLYYLYRKRDFTETQVDTFYLWILVFITISIFWMPFTIEYSLKNKTYIQYTIYLVLFLVALAALMILHTLLQIKERELKQERQLAIVGTSYLFFHTFIMDFVLWTHSFF